MEDTLKVQILTQSNLFIGGAPTPFEIGGIDQYTVTTPKNLPYIPASTLKGALRTIVREDDSTEKEEIATFYTKYMAKEKEDKWPDIVRIYENSPDRVEILKRIEKKYSNNITTEMLFGMEGFNNTPRLLFSDLYLDEEKCGNLKYFSINAKNSLETKNNQITSNPRTYKTVSPGIKFRGEIRFYKMDLMGEDFLIMCRDYIIRQLDKFNEGIYRIGNSKSRGYGKVQMIFMDGNGGKEE
jgi:Uncharacterized protein predicted to be involved in DNA repair (RAMP superfamily)